MSERAPYSRTYWSVMEDPKFDGVREDCRLFGAWSLLLIAADMAYPSPAYLLPTVPRSAVARLAEAGLIDVLEGHRYRIHGLDAERTRRRIAATSRDPSGTRVVSERDLNGQQAKQSRAKTSKDEADARESMPGDDGRADLEAFLLVTRRAPTPRQRQLLDGLLERHDLLGPAWAADIIYRHPDDPIGAVIEADKAWRAERIAEAQSQETPKPKPRRKRSMPESTRELLAHWAAENLEVAK